MTPLLGRDGVVSVALGGGLLVFALALVAVARPDRPPSLLAACALIALLAVASRVEFEVGPGSAVPTQVVLVPMLFVLPPAVVPLAVAAAYLLGSLPDHLTGRVHPQRAFVVLSYCWHAAGPALVLVVLGSRDPRASDWPIYVLALGAQFAFDFVSSAARERLAFGVSPRRLLPFLSWTYAVDVLLAPVGLVAAFAAMRGVGFALVVVAPLIGLLTLLARDRRTHIDRALELDDAFQGASREARSDTLTGLANRLAWEEAVVAAESLRGVPHSLVLVDIDELKVANDTLGHAVGDELLRAIATVVRANVRETDLVARVGGDELAVLMVGADTNACRDTVARVAEAIRRHPPVESFQLAAALGWSTTSPGGGLSDAFSAADARMYLDKQRARLTARRRETRDALLRAVGERHPDLDDHLQGVTLLAQAVGERLRLSPEQLDELARAAELHDVGKIAIPDAILQKAGPLDEDEWRIVRRHPLVGERILSAVPALHVVAGIVRASHERFDGRGYPDGVGGDEIPLAARVVSVCDAFDAMTSARPYKAAISPERALDELRRCAGSQFDPGVVSRFCEIVGDRATARPQHAAA